MLLEMFKALESHGITVTSPSNCQVYMPESLKKNSLVRNSIEYCLHVGGQIQDRQVILLMQLSDQRLLALVMRLSGVNQEAAEQITAIIREISDIEAILKNKVLVEKFRQLYQNVECTFLGFNQSDQNDIDIAKNKLGELIAKAYAAPVQDIPVTFIPFNPARPNVLLEDLLSVVKPPRSTPVALQPQIVANQEATIIYKTKERVENTDLPQAAASAQTVNYNVNAIMTLLKASDIGSSPQSECYVYPPLTQVPANFLIRDNIEYFLHAKDNVQGRRVGVLIPLENQRLSVLVIELFGLNQEIIKEIRAILISNPSDNPDIILQNQLLVTLFRQLYARVNCNLLGLNQQDANNKELIQKLEQLLKIGYLIPKITINLIPSDIQCSNVVLLEDSLNVLKRDLLERFTPTNEDSITLFRKHMGQGIEALIKKVSIFASSHPDLYKQITEKALVSFKYAAFLQQLGQFKTLSDLEQYKQKVYEISALDFQQYFSVIDVNLIIDLLNVEQPELFLQKIEELKVKQLADFLRLEKEFKINLLLNRDSWSTVQEQAAVIARFAYNSTMIPMSSTLSVFFGTVIDDNFALYPLYEGLKNVAQQIPGLVAYYLTFSEAFSQRVSQTISANLALQIAGGLLGAAWSYFLGFSTLVRMMVHSLISTLLFSFGYNQKPDDQTATLSLARFHDISPNVVGRLSGLLMVIVEIFGVPAMGRMLGLFTETMGLSKVTEETGAIAETPTNAYLLLIAYLGSVLCSMAAVKIIHPEKPATQEDIAISFLASMSGLQIGQAIMSFLLGMYSIVNFKLEKRAELTQQLQQLEAEGEIANLKIQMNSLMDPVEWVTYRDDVKVSYVNVSSGFFHFSDCVLTSEQPDCITELVDPPLRLTSGGGGTGMSW